MDTTWMIISLVLSFLFEFYQSKPESMLKTNNMSLERMLISLRRTPPHTARELLLDIAQYYQVSTLEPPTIAVTNTSAIDRSYLSSNEKSNLSNGSTESLKIITSIIHPIPTSIGQSLKWNGKKIQNSISALSFDDIQPSAECQPELKTIRLVGSKSSVSGIMFTPFAGNTVSSLAAAGSLTNQDIYFPHCIRVPRCGGCCPSERLTCSPKLVTWHNVSMVHVRFSSMERKFRFHGLQHVLVEHHHVCGCECIQKPNDCTQWQVYHEDECRCVCSMERRWKCIQRFIDNSSMNLLKRQTSQMNRSFLFWNETNCQCQCRAPVSGDLGKFIGMRTDLHLGYHPNINCLDGSTFNFVNCRCEPSSVVEVAAKKGHIQNNISRINYEKINKDNYNNGSFNTIEAKYLNKSMDFHQDNGIDIDDGEKKEEHKSAQKTVQSNNMMVASDGGGGRLYRLFYNRQTQKQSAFFGHVQPITRIQRKKSFL